MKFVSSLVTGLVCAGASTTDLDLQRMLQDMGDEGSYGDAEEPTLPNLVDLSKGAGLNTLVTAITAAGLDSTLSSAGSFTVLAPNDAAFDKVDSAVLAALLEDENKEMLASVLTYHVHGGLLTSEILSGNAEILSGKKFAVTTLEGTDVFIEAGDDGKTFTVNGAATIVAFDQMASNGVAHVIDAVLIPESVATWGAELTATEAPTEAPTKAPTKEKDEADCDRSGQAAYAPGDCVLNGSPDKTNCNGTDFNLDLYVKGADGKYTAHTESCVIGNNLNWMSESDTVESCQAKCDAQDDCLAIEFGVAYGGLKKGTKSTGDCTKDAPTKPPTEASTDAPKRSKPVHDAEAVAKALEAYTVVGSIDGVTLTPTKAPTSPALKEGQYLKTETKTVDAVEAKMKIALTATEAENKAVIQSLEHGVADAIGAQKTNVKVDAINGKKQTRRRLAEVEITFIIIAENAADIAQLQTDIVAAGAEGSIVANIQRHAAANGVLTAELKAMNPTVTIAAPTKTTTTVTVVTVETGTDPNAPTKAPTTDDTMNAASLPALSSMASAICLAMITLLVA